MKFLTFFWQLMLVVHFFFQMSENDDASTSFESHDRETHNEKIRKKM